MLYDPLRITRKDLVIAKRNVTLSIQFTAPLLNNLTITPSFAIWNETKTHSLATNSGSQVYIPGDATNIGSIVIKDARVTPSLIQSN